MGRYQPAERVTRTEKLPFGFGLGSGNGLGRAPLEWPAASEYWRSTMSTDNAEARPCEHCGAGPSQTGSTQVGSVVLPADELEQWFDTLQGIARTLTLVREALGDPPEDLYEVIHGMEEQAWQLAGRLDELADGE